MAGKIAVILAAGLGKRMNSSRHKVVHEVCGKPMITHIVEEMQSVGFQRIVVVVGKLEEQVRAVLGDSVTYVRQHEQLGTGHAVMQALPFLTDSSLTIVLYGDSPLIQKQDVVRLIDEAEKNHSTTVLTAEVEDPFAYGRIVRARDGSVDRIVEEKDANDIVRQIHEVNSGIYAFQTSELQKALPKMTADNAQGEYLLTDCVVHIRSAGGRVIPVLMNDPRDIANVNDRVQLAHVEKQMQSRILNRHMQNGVTIIDPTNTYAHADVKIGRDTVLYPGTILEGRTIIGTDCVIGPNSHVVNTTISDQVTVQSSVVLDSRIDQAAVVGPFAYIRPHSDIGARAKIGDFVEIKKSTIGADTKISHLSYVGDSEVGARVNIGCGVVTVNYDGFVKHQTTIGDDSFIGSNVNLVAPIRIGTGGYVATGSTVTDEVPEDAFAIARTRQTTKLGYVKGLKERLRKKSENGQQ
jgi:bifunctional UDP-N-acetylglucosamine pyrophosphorylase/glucosamine-1-phosphate N-acetyltransferase